MPAIFDENGQPVSAKGFQSPDAMPTNTKKRAPWEDMLGGAAITLNEVTMGAVPAAANLAAQLGMGKGASEAIQKYLSDAEESAGPGASTFLKLAGAMGTPLPFGKVKAASTLGKIALGAGKGALMGGVSAGMHNIGKAAPGEIDAGSLIQDTGIGAGLGGGLGGAFGAGAAYLSGRAARTGFAGAGGTAGRIGNAAKNYPTSEFHGLDLAKDAIARGRDMQVPTNIPEAVERHTDIPANLLSSILPKKWQNVNTTGIHGRFGQGFESVAERAHKVAQHAGQTEEAILAKEGRLIKLHADVVKQDVLEPLIDALKRNGNLSSADKRAIARLELEWKSFVGKKDKLSIADLAKMRESLSDTLQGAYGQMPLGQNLEVSTLAKFRSNLSDLEDKALRHFVPEVGARFVQAKQQYHSAMILRAMATKGDISDLGLMETLLGKGIRGMANTAALSKLGLAGPASYAASSALGGGRIPNTILSLDQRLNSISQNRLKNVLDPLTTQRAGRLAGGSVRDMQDF